MRNDFFRREWDDCIFNKLVKPKPATISKRVKEQGNGLFVRMSLKILTNLIILFDEVGSLI